MKQITVAYWHSHIKGIKYKHNKVFDYSTRRRNTIIDHVLKNNCSVMIRPMQEGIIIWIDNGRFGQR